MVIVFGLAEAQAGVSSPRGVSLATLNASVAKGYPKTETYYPWRDYTPRALQLNIIHLKASVFAVSLRCHP